MDTETQAQIYLANQRGNFESEGFRSFRTLNFAEYQASGREAVGKIISFNDETLAPEQIVTLSAPEPCMILLIPLIGGLEVNTGKAEPEFASAGEMLYFNANPDTDYQITNPFPDHTINYLQLRFAGVDSDETVRIAEFDLGKKNELLPVEIELGEIKIYIGKYDGREEGVLIRNNPGQPIFTFIIEGAFEIQNRLLEKRDALSVWNTGEMEFEALSQDAVILIIIA